MLCINTSIKNFPSNNLPLFSSALPTSTVFSNFLAYLNITFNTALHGYRLLEDRSMHKQIGKIGAIRRELDGRACPFCGGHKYQLVLRGNMPARADGLFARCSQCQRPRGLDEDLDQ